MKLLAVHEPHWTPAGGSTILASGTNVISNDNEVMIHHGSCSSMTSRPLKKVKYNNGGEGAIESVGHSEINGSIDSTPAAHSSSHKQSSTSSVRPERTLEQGTIDGPSNPSDQVSTDAHSKEEEEDGDVMHEESNPDQDVDPAQNPVHYALRLWQSRQIAQGIFDNVINKVLGDLGVPLHLNDPSNHNNLNEFVNLGSFLSAQNIENEGVAEAIRQQGLQRKRFEELWRQHQHTPATIGATTDKLCNDHAGATMHCDSKDQFYSPMTDCTLPGTVSGLTDAGGGSSSSEVDRRVANPLLVPSPSSSSCRSSSVLAYNGGHLVDSCDATLSANDIMSDIEVRTQAEDLLNTAVTCAISEKGLEVLNDND